MGFFVHKKKLLTLFASPHGHGCTRRLLDSFLEPFRENASWDMEEVDVYELNAHPCTGCGACAKKEGCSFGDLDPLDKSLRQSDLLVIASPVYNSSFPSPMKAVLDRTQRYFEARFSLGIRPPVKKHRDAVLLLTMGSREESAVEMTARQLERAFSVMNTALRGCGVWDGTDLGEELREARQHRDEALKKARELALEILAEM